MECVHNTKTFPFENSWPIYVIPGNVWNFYVSFINNLGPYMEGNKYQIFRYLRPPPPTSNGKKTVINKLDENGTLSNHRSKHFKNLQPDIYFDHYKKKSSSVFSGTLLRLLSHISLHD
jgi:hypothetical protein